MVSNFFAHSVGSSFPYLWNFGTWTIFCFLEAYASASCRFSKAYANAVNAWAIILFCPLSRGGLLPLSFPSFIFWFRGKGGGGWLGGWLKGRLGGLLSSSSSSSSSSLSGDSSGELLLLVWYLIWYLSCFPLNKLDSGVVIVCPKVTFLFAGLLSLRRL